jgi:hypothetical protein
MSALTQVLLLAGNLIALIIGFTALVAWFRRWLIKVVSEPITNLSKDVQAVKADIEATKAEAHRANSRIDDMLMLTVAKGLNVGGEPNA